MNPLPTWLRRLWDTWDLRVLVLLSFTLQIVLSQFGNRRKSTSSVWINSVLVWPAYLMADWIATVALGKLSDAQSDREKGNVLWAPLLLLHLGGPDTITAYSLEDNQLWMRHLTGLVVQLSVAIYIILMSWQNSWFSFMSLPALVAGMIKYGERTWVLKWVSDDKYLTRRPFASLTDKYPTEGHDYVRVLIVAHEHLILFMEYLKSVGFVIITHEGSPHNRDSVVSKELESNILWDAIGVQMGLMYDLLYTKSPAIYSKGGLIMRCISFGCTVTVLLGLTFQIVHLKTREKENWHEIDIAITGVLTAGALALEIYAVIVIFSSNWMMLWLIKHGKKEWVTWLSQKFPWLFNKKKNWSQMMGQFDLLGYYIKLTEPGRQSPTRKIIRLVLGENYEHKWDRYQHSTAYSIPPRVYNAILQLHERGYDMSDELREICEIIYNRGTTGTNTFLWQTGDLHFATEICYHLEMEWDDHDPSGSDDSSLWKQDREVSKVVSDYMMYLLIMHPSLLPNVGSLRAVERNILFDYSLSKDSDRGSLTGIGNARDVKEACRNMLSRKEENRSKIVEILKGKEKPKRWVIIKLMWLRTLGDATVLGKAFGKKSSHFQQLRQGGELLTFIWFHIFSKALSV